MFRQAQFESLNDFFLPLSKRRSRSIFFCRIDGYSNEIDAFVKRYFDEARRSGVVIDERIPNPTPNNLSYFTEMMGSDFAPNEAFLDANSKSGCPVCPMSSGSPL